MRQVRARQAAAKPRADAAAAQAAAVPVAPVAPVVVPAPRPVATPVPAIGRRRPGAGAHARRPVPREGPRLTGPRRPRPPDRIDRVDRYGEVPAGRLVSRRFMERDAAEVQVLEAGQALHLDPRTRSLRGYCCRCWTWARMLSRAAREPTITVRAPRFLWRSLIEMFPLRSEADP